MKLRKVVGLDGILIEVWRYLGEVGVKWLTNFFNKICLTKKMTNKWRKNILVSLYMNKGDIQSCSNYYGIKLMCHTIKLWERVMQNIKIIENQFRFSQGDR